MRIPRAQTGRARFQLPRVAEQTGLTDAFSQLSDVASQFAKQARVEQENQQMLSAQTELRKWTDNFRLAAEERQGAEAEGVSRQFSEGFDQKFGQVLDRVDSDRVRQSLQQWADKYRPQNFLPVARYERREGRRAAQNNLQASLESIEQNLARDGDIARANEEIEEAYAFAVSSGAMTAEEARAERLVAKDRAKSQAFAVAYANDPEGAISNIGQYDLGDVEVSKWQDKHAADQRAAQREARRLARESANGVVDKVPGYEIIAQETGDTTGLRDAANQLYGLGFDDKAKDIERTADTYDAAYGTMTEIKSMPIPEAIEMVQGMGVSTDDPFAAEQQAKVNKVAKDVLANQIRKFKDDPAAFVQEQAVGETQEEIARSRMRLQVENGLLPDQTKILTSQELADFSSQWNSGGARDKADLVDGVHGEYGPELAPKVLAEAKVPTGALLAAWTRDVEAKELIVTAATTKVPTPPGDYKSGDYAAEADGTDLAGLLEEVRLLAPANTGVLEAVTSTRKTMENMAKLLGQGEIEDWSERNYYTINTDRVKVFFPSNRDSNMVESGLEDWRQSYIDEQEDVRFKSLIRDAVWVNEGNGFSLIDVATGRKYPGSYVGIESLASQDEFVNLPQSGGVAENAVARGEGAI